MRRVRGRAGTQETSRSSGRARQASSRLLRRDAGRLRRIIDALPALGGQLMALYPEKYIFDVAGFPKVLAKDLVRDMAIQGLQFGATTHLGEVVTGLRRVEDGDGRATSCSRHRRRLSDSDHHHRGRHRCLRGSEARGSRVRTGTRRRGCTSRCSIPSSSRANGCCWWRRRFGLRLGGQPQGVAKSVMLIHRRDGFRAHQATINQVQELHRRGHCELRTFWEVKALHGNGRVERVTIFNNKTKEEETLEIDAVIPLLGFHSDLGAIKEWGLDTEKADIKVDQVMETNVPGIYAAGDITSYPGKLKLIATGLPRRASRSTMRCTWINPKAKVNPGHSSNMAIFGQKDD